ncbi:head-tail connector protein [Parabacteroides sp. Marseille-P3160]|uniref:head-tail connector protein n=1 Tax=Parabacteroides sp. Marseille-P3160 TaxID=1917887 RepID=UPI0009BB2BB2|nr:head-tail connector protein [Parabacteroides sp. Marseille-P3160]
MAADTVYTTLEEAKDHLIANDPEYTADDGLLMGIIIDAELIVSSDLGRPLSDFVDGNGMLVGPVRRAILLMIGHLYTNREPVAFANATEIPLSYKYLIDLERNYYGGDKA